MSLVKRVSTGVSTAIRIIRGTAAEDWAAYFGSNGGRKTKAGTKIHETSAMTISALYAALNFLGGVVASLPLRVRRTLPAGGSEPATDHPLYDRLHAKANDSGLTAWQWIYTSLLHKYLWGNWWAHVNRFGGFELTPLLPDRTWIDMRNPMIVHTRENNGREIILDRRDVLLIPHVSLGGVMGKGVVHYARESLGLIKAQEEFASGFFGSGVKAGGFVQVPADQEMKEETRKGLQKDFNKKYGELGESWKAIFLTGGAEWNPNEIDATKAQVLESREFSIAEVSRWTGLAPHLLHDLSRATFSNIEELDLALVIFTITPIVTQAEQAMNVTFFDERERQTLYVKFDLKGLLRGNLEARAGFYTQMLDRGVFNADNVLALEDMNPQPEGLGKVYVMPLNMMNKKMIVGTQPLSLKVAPIRDVTPTRAGIAAPQRFVAQRTSAHRRRITIAYSTLWESYAAQILKEEAESLRSGITEWLGERSAAEFVTWLDTFYESFHERIDALSAPLLSSYADAILPIAQQEIGNDEDLEAQTQAFLSGADGYHDTFIRRHIRHSRGSLATAVTDAEDPEAAAEEVLEDWKTLRPERLRLHESIRSESAFTRNVFVLAGVTKLVSVSYGKSCPYCLALDGKVIEIQGAFLEPGDFQPEGAERPLTVTSIRRHPPYHDGCDCGIEASI
ncbi:MAG TPA: phage portal protein [Sedimentisphaerales bacterium]|nr:phage portal protein [Sedimentisphaerales bacterium]